MEKIIRTFTSLFLFTVCLCTLQPAIALPADEIIEHDVRTLMRQYNIPGAAVITYQNGKTTKYVYGVMNIKTKVPVESNTIFEIGSVTKTFTSLLLALEVTDHQVDLNDHLVDYLDEDKAYSSGINNITLLELATHTSGLPYNSPGMAYNAASTKQNSRLLNNFLHSWHSLYPPGSAELYSNIGFAMLGIALANYEQEPLYRLMQDKILQPLRMNNSSLTIAEDKIKFYAQGYTARGTPSRSPNGGLLAGSWGLKVSVNDMAQFLKLAVLNNSTPDKLRGAMKTTQSGYFRYDDKTQIGMAWMIQPLDQIDQKKLVSQTPLVPRKTTPNHVTKINKPEYIENALIEKTGATNGFRAYIGVIPEQKAGIVIMVNRFIYDNNAVKLCARRILLNK